VERGVLLGFSHEPNERGRGLSAPKVLGYPNKYVHIIDIVSDQIWQCNPSKKQVCFYGRIPPQYKGQKLIHENLSATKLIDHEKEYDNS